MKAYLLPLNKANTNEHNLNRGVTCGTSTQAQCNENGTSSNDIINPPAQQSAHNFYDVNNIEMSDGAESIQSTMSSTIPPTNSYATIAATKPSKVMPIQLDFVDRAAAAKIHELIKTNVAENSFEWVQFHANAAPKISADSMETKRQIIEILSNNGIQFNTFAEKGTQCHAFIVRGLNFGDDNHNISLIASTLNTMGYSGDVEIQRHLTGHMKRNEGESQNALYRFTLCGNQDFSGLANITNINGFRVKVEKMKKSCCPMSTLSTLPAHSQIMPISLPLRPMFS